MEPKYVLKAYERELLPKNDSTALYILKKILWIIVAVLAVGSLVSGENLFSLLSLSTKCILIILVVVVIRNGGSEQHPSPFELRFYDDYLILYREKSYYNRKISKMEYNKVFYAGIRECEFNETTKRVTIHGVVEGIWYNYKKDGTLPKEPSYHKTTDSMCYFYTTFSPDIDIVAEIEQHSPIKVCVR